MRAAVLLQTIVAATAVAVAAVLLLPFTPVDGFADDAAAAARVAAFGPADMSDAGAVVLLLDERSVDSARLTPIPRALMSPIWTELARKALDNGATAIGFDFVLAFDGGALRVGDTRPLKDYDAPFLRLLLKEARAGRVVLGRSGELAPARRFGMMASRRGVAFVDVAADPDGVVRRIRSGYRLADDTIVATLSGAVGGRSGADETPIVPPAPLTDLPAASVIDVLDCADAAALARLFKGRAVLVGTGLPGEDRLRAPDRFMTRAAPIAAADPCAFAKPDVRAPLGDVPGVYLHAAAIDARASGWALQPATPAAVAVVAALAAAAAALAGLGLTPVFAALAAFALCAIGFAGAAVAQEAGLLFPAFRPALAVLLGVSIGTAARQLLLNRRATALRRSFGRYLAPELVARIVSQERLPELDGEERHVTIMFADLSGFTALSERVDGKTLTATVNAYLGIIAGEVERSGGYVDKFIGDAVMAIWNAPVDLAGHERAAVQAAVAIRDGVNAAAARDAARGLPNFAIKVGVNSGKAILGNVGAENRLNYTAVGDTVNIAARMEGLPSVFLTPIVLGAACAAAAADDFAMLEIASIQVKGRQEPIAVFAPLAEADRSRFAAYDAALAAYRSRDFAAAEAGWTALAAVAWSGAGLSGAMAGFARGAMDERLDDNWNGAVVMRTK